jgi:hypothetical protein
MIVVITVKKLKIEKTHSELPNILEYGTTKTGLQTTKLFFTEDGKSKNGPEMRRCTESCHDVCSLSYYRSAVSRCTKVSDIVMWIRKRLKQTTFQFS